MSRTMLFNPYTGTPRHPSDIQSDPEGILLLDPDGPIRATRPAPSEPSADVLLLREMFALCEATEEECADIDDHFKRGRAFEAKRIRRAIGTWYQDTFCGRTHMGEPVPHPAPSEPSDIERKYEELRALIDGGSESMTHADAMDAVRHWRAQHEAAAPGEPSDAMGMPPCGKPLCSPGNHHPLCDWTPSEPSEAISAAAPTSTWTVIAPDGARFEGETPFRAASAANKHLGRSLYDPEKAAEFQALIADVRRESEAENARLRAEHGSLDCPTCGGSGHVGDALARPALSDEPPFDLVDRCAQRIASWEDGCKWPDGWDSADVARMRLDAKRVLLEAREWIFETARRPAIESAGVLCTPEGSWEIADAARVIAWARDPQRKPAVQAFTAGAERQAAYWIEWAWSEPAEIRREALREAVRICVGVRADHTRLAAQWSDGGEAGRQMSAVAEGADACAEAITREINASLPAQPSEGY